MSERVCQCGTPLPLNAHGRQKWCSNRCRKRHYGDLCVECGARTTYGAEHARIPEPRCDLCARALQSEEWMAYRQMVEAMWAEGMTARQIGDALGWTLRNPGAHISQMRARGYNLPSRRTPEQLARMGVGAAERMAKARATYRAMRAAA